MQFTALSPFNLRGFPSCSGEDLGDSEGLWILLVWKEIQKSLNECMEKVTKTTWDISHCWNQVADEDGYITQPSARMNDVHKRLMMLDGRLTETSEDVKMNHDYKVVPPQL